MTNTKIELGVVINSMIIISKIIYLLKIGGRHDSKGRKFSKALW